MSTPKQPQKPQQPQKHRSVGRTLTYAFTVVLLVIIVIAFVGTPAVGGIAVGNRITFGSYAGREITYEPGNYFARQYQDIARYVQQQGHEVTELLVQQVWRAAFDRAVFHEAVLLLAEEAGVSVSAREVDRAIARWPEFQENGRFSSSRYNSMPSQARFELRQYLRGVLVQEKVQQDIFGDARMSEPEREFLLRMAGPERRFRFVQFSFGDYPESEVVAYGQANANRFRRMGLSVITVGSEADAQRVREQAVTRQASFEDLARNQSRDSYADEGGSMGRVYHFELEPDFENLAVIDGIFALEPGEISPVYATTFGWAFYRAEEPAIDPDFSDASVVSAVRSYLNTFERGRVEDYLTARARDFADAARREGFAAAAAAIDQSPQLTEFFPINYGDNPYFGSVSAPTNQVISTSAAYREDFFRNLFALREDEVSDPLVIRDYTFVFQLDDERQPDEQTMDFLTMYLPFILRELAQEQAQQTIVDRSRLTDNFARAYSQAVFGR